MDTSKLVVGQKVWIFGCGWFEGVVVRLLPDGGVEVATDWAVTQFVNKDTKWAVAQFDNKGTDGSVAQFDNKGNETDDSHYRRLNGEVNGPGPEWGQWELRERDREAEKAEAAKAKEAFETWCEGMFSTFYPRPK